MPSDKFNDPCVINLSGTKCLNRDGGGLCDTYGIGDLDLTTVCQACSNYILGDIATCISCRTINL